MEQNKHVKWNLPVSSYAYTRGAAALNTLRPRQNDQYFADDTFKRIFLNENIIILFKIPFKFVPKGPIENNPALVQIMASRRLGDKPLYEPMMIRVPTHICVTRPQWVNEARVWLNQSGAAWLRYVTAYSGVVQNVNQPVPFLKIDTNIYWYYMRLYITVWSVCCQVYQQLCVNSIFIYSAHTLFLKSIYKLIRN